MNKISVWICLVFCFAISSLIETKAESSDSSVIFNADFYKNEVKDYELIYSNYTLNGVDTTSLESVKSKLSIFIQDSTTNSYIIKWTLTDFSVNTSERNIFDLVRLAKPVNLVFRTSRHGILADFIDWSAVTSSLDEGIGKVIEKYSDRKDSSAIDEVKRIFSFRELFEAMILRSVNMYHQAYGLGYDLGKEVDVPSEVSGTGLPEPVKCIIRKKLTGLDKENSLAALSTATFIDKIDFKTIFSKFYPDAQIPYAVQNQTITGGLISHYKTGWLIYTFEQRERNYSNACAGEILEIRSL